MIQNILHYFTQKKALSFCFLFVLGVMAYGSLAKSSAPQAEKNYTRSAAIDELKSVETQLKERLKDPGALEAILKEEPATFRLLNGMTYFAVFLILMGVIVNARWLASESFRRKYILESPEGKTEWQLSMIFEMVVFFLFGRDLLSILSGVLQGTGLLKIPMNQYLLLHTTVVDFLCLAIILLIIRGAGGQPRELGFRILDNNPWKEIKVGLFSYAAILPVFIGTLFVLVLVATFFAYEPPSHPLVTIFLEEEVRTPWLVGYSIFLAVVIGPILEEIVFRGFCYTILKKKFGVVAAMILSATFFAFIHQNAFAFVPIFILGIFLAYIYEIRGSLAAPMIIHVSHNLIFITTFFSRKRYYFSWPADLLSKSAAGELTLLKFTGNIVILIIDVSFRTK